MKSIDSEAVIKEIKGRLSIVSLVETYLSLKRLGKSHVGLCPFHDDKNPSLHVNEEKGLFHCFSCGAGGDIFGFIMRYNNLSFPEALAELARRADVKLERGEAHTRRKSRSDTLYRINGFVSKFYHKMLVEGNEGRESLRYLAGRGMSSEMIEEFQIGYAPDSWDSVTRLLAGKKIPLNLAEEIGLVIKKQNKDGYYDRFRKRIMFPIRDVAGQVVGFGGRTLSGEDPKYMNSPESQLYHKKGILYGLDRSREYIRREKQAVVVEGYMDFLSLYFAGIKNAVATLGTSLTREHAAILRRYTDRVIVVFDGDEAGKRASLRVLHVFLEEDLKPFMAILPEGHDPASFISEGRGAELESLLQDSRPIMDFLIERKIRDFQDRKTSRSESVKEITSILSGMKDTIERSYYVRRVGESFGVRENELLSMLSYEEKLEERTRTKTISNHQEKLILKIILKFPTYSRYLKEEDLLHLIPKSEIKTVLQEIVKDDYKDLSSLLSKFDNGSVQQVVSEAVFLSDDVPDEATAWKMLKDCVQRLKLKKVEDDLRLLRYKIDQAIAERDGVLEKSLIREYRDLIQEEKSIRGRDR